MALARKLTFVDCLGLGINGIIGVGIFLLPGAVLRRAGGWGPLAWLLGGALCLVVARVFAEAAARTDESGGPYRYAALAFGPRVGFAVGWFTLVSGLLGYATVARGFAEHAAPFLGALLPPRLERALVLSLLVALLMAVNLRGVEPSARTSDAVGAFKVLALVGLIAVGLFFVEGSSLAAAPAPRPDEPRGLFAAAFAGLFALTGFEYVPVPAGETVDPRRTVARAMLVALALTTLLYAALQAVVVGAGGPEVAGSETPVVTAVSHFAGPLAGKVVDGLALVSAFGFASGSALVVPRYLEIFARDGFLPAALGRRSRRDVPAVAIVAVSLLVAALGATIDLGRLLDVSTAAVVVQYLSTCLAVMVLAGRPPARGVVVRWLLPLVGVGGSLAFLSQLARGEAIVSAMLLASGLPFALLRRRVSSG